MPQDRLMSRFLPMLGAARRLGVDPRVKTFKPKIRIAGVFKGADVLQRLIATGEYHVLPAVNVHLGVQMGMVDKAWAETMRLQLPADEYLRQFLCMNVKKQKLDLGRAHPARGSARCDVSIGCSSGRVWETGVLDASELSGEQPDEQP